MTTVTSDRRAHGERKGERRAKCGVAVLLLDLEKVQLSSRLRSLTPVKASHGKGHPPRARAPAPAVRLVYLGCIFRGGSKPDIVWTAPRGALQRMRGSFVRGGQSSLRPRAYRPPADIKMRLQQSAGAFRPISTWPALMTDRARCPLDPLSAWRHDEMPGKIEQVLDADGGP